MVWRMNKFTILGFTEKYDFYDGGGEGGGHEKPM